MLQRLLLVGMFFSILSVACNNSGSRQSGEKEGDMSQFAADEEFKNKHQEPAKDIYYGKGRMIKFATPDGKEGSAYVLAPAQSSGKVLFIIHEWWGLNDHIKKEADRLFDSLQNVTVMALDLYEGKVADNQDDAAAYMQLVTAERSEAIIKGALGQAGSGAKVATIGWCFGGGWSLRASIMAGAQGAGCVMYYGMPVTELTELGPLKAEVLAIFASQDAWITPQVAEDFQKAAKSANKKLRIEMFDADHAFANPSGDNYDAVAAEKANAAALAFLREKLK